MAEPAPTPPSRRLSPDMIAALSAVVIGVCALGVSLYQAAVMRGQQEIMQAQQDAMVWPFLEVGPSLNSRGFHIDVANQGIGPARVRAARVTVDGAPVRFWDEALDALFGEGTGARGAFGWSTLRGRVIPPDGNVQVLFLAPGAGADSAFAAVDRLGAEVCYCSVYDACWTARLGFATEPEPTDDCAHIPEAERFEYFERGA